MWLPRGQPPLSTPGAGGHQVTAEQGAGGPQCPIWQGTKQSLCPSTPTPAGFLRDPQPPWSTEHPRKTPTSSSADVSEAPPFRIAAEATARTAPPRKALEENAEYLAPERGDRG